MLIFRASNLPAYLIAAVFFLLTVDSASAQSGVGLLAGISADPEQVYFGGHIDAAEITNKFWFRPSVEIGFGDSRTLVGLNAEFVYRPSTRKEWNPYFGGGPAAVIQTFRAGPGHDTHFGPGFNFVAGVEQRMGFLAEVKIGVLDSPGFKLGVGWNWRR
jgi:hypothetical protein